MEKQLEEIRENQKASWNKFSPGWKKWDALMMDFLNPMGNEIINSLNLKDDAVVLDIASGTGEPGLTIATKLKKGKVILTDLSDGMLEVAKENAKRKDLKNIETMVCDVSELPFSDNTFDAISCRFGFMFFPNMSMAAKEMTRVLKPGGRIATAVWNIPEKNFWVTAISDPINKNMQLPPPLPEAPGIFRCSKPNLLQQIFQENGLKNTFEKETISKLKCGNSDVYWNFLTEVAAPFVAALSKADDALKVKIKKEVFNLLDQKFPDGKVNIDGSALIICGEK